MFTVHGHILYCRRSVRSPHMPTNQPASEREGCGCGPPSDREPFSPRCWSSHVTSTAKCTFKHTQIQSGWFAQHSNVGDLGISRELWNAWTLDRYHFKNFCLIIFLYLAYQTIASLVYCYTREQRKGLLRESREREGSMRHFSTKPMDSTSSKAMNFAPSAGQQW